MLSEKGKVVIAIIIALIGILLLCGCDMKENNVPTDTTTPTTQTMQTTQTKQVDKTRRTTQTTKQKGRCLEYKTEYHLDCGLFVDPDRWCKERKYDVCVRWEEI